VAAASRVASAALFLALVPAGCGKDRGAPSAPYGCKANGCPSGMQVGGTQPK
jgi:hypothetical protein